MINAIRRTLLTQNPDNTGVVPPHLQTPPKNGGIVPPHLQPKPQPTAPDTGKNGGIVPPHLQPKPQPTAPDTGSNGGIVPPHLQPKPGNTGIVPPHIQDRLEQRAPVSPRLPALQVAGGHVPTRQDPFAGVEINPGDFGRCPPSSAAEMANTPGGRKIIDAWFNQRVNAANQNSAGSYDVEFFPEDNAWQFNFQGTGSWFQFDGNELRVIDTEGERRIPVAQPLTAGSLIQALEQA